MRASGIVAVMKRRNGQRPVRRQARASGVCFHTIRRKQDAQLTEVIDLRCINSRDGDCGFFLTEKDEPKARLQKSQDVPTSAPRTPAARRAVDAIPTPTTGSGSRVGLFSGGSMKSYTSRINDSPSARRRRANTADDDDLASRVIDLLRDDEIAIKPITESAIRHIIGEEISSLESKLQNSEKSLKFALEKLENAPK